MNFIKNCGIMIEPQEGMEIDEIARTAQLTEEFGYGYLFRSDHLLPTTRHKGLESPECWVSLGAVAKATKSVKFGTMVSPIGFRNPALLARMACTVDALSSGRLQLGVGAGWYREEYFAHGFEFPAVGVRKEQFHEALQIIRPLTQSGRVEFRGKYYSAHLEDLPKRKRGIHMIIGAKSRSIARETAEYADEWNFFGSLPPKFEEIKVDLEASGREIEISQMAPFIVAENGRELQARIRSEMRRQGVNKEEGVFARHLAKTGWLVAPRKDFADRVNELREKGVERFYYQIRETKETSQVELLSEFLRSL